MVFLAVVLVLVALAVIILGVCAFLARDEDRPVMLESRDVTAPTGWLTRPLRTDVRRLGAPANAR